MRLGIFAAAAIILMSFPALADRTFECTVNEGRASSRPHRLIIKSKSPDRFPNSYTSLTIQDILDGKVAYEVTYPLELMQGSAKQATFRFFLGVGPETLERFGLLDWDPGRGILYINFYENGIHTRNPAAIRVNHTSDPSYYSRSWWGLGKDTDCRAH